MSEPIPIPQSKYSISYWLRSSDKNPSPTLVEKPSDSEIFEMDDDEQVSDISDNESEVIDNNDFLNNSNLQDAYIKEKFRDWFENDEDKSLYYSFCSKKSREFIEKYKNVEIPDYVTIWTVGTAVCLCGLGEQLVIGLITWIFFKKLEESSINNEPYIESENENEEVCDCDDCECDFNCDNCDCCDDCPTISDEKKCV